MRPCLTFGASSGYASAVTLEAHPHIRGRRISWCAHSLLLALPWLAIGCIDDATPEQPALQRSEQPEQCTPGRVRSCFDGPAERMGVGICQAGHQVCAEHGKSWGACTGQVTPQTENCSTSLDENCDGIVSCGQTTWSQRLGIGRGEIATAVASDDSGNVYLTGYYRDPINLGGGALPIFDDSRDGFVLKLSPEGEHIWSRGFYGDNHIYPRAIAVNATGQVLVAASYSGPLWPDTKTPLEAESGTDALLLFYDADGTLLWRASYGSSEAQYPFKVAFDNQGDIIVTGYYDNEITFGTEPLVAYDPHYEAYVAKLSDTGEHIWSRSFPGVHDQVSRAIAIDDDDNIYLGGYFLGDVDFGDGLQIASGDDRDGFVVKLDATGTTLWSRTFGDESLQRVYSVAVDSEGNPVAVGRFKGSIDFGPDRLDAASGGAGFIVKYGSDGRYLWSHRLGGSANQGATDVAIDSHDRAVVTGFYEGYVQLGHTLLPESGVYEPSIYLSKLEPDGAFVWSRGIRVHANQSAAGLFRGYRAVAVDPNDQILLAGFIEGPLDLGNGELEDLGAEDIFVAKLAP